MAVKDEQQSIPFDIWRSSGTTEHIGGIFATQRLLDLCHIAQGQRVLDIGCGTGFTACYLAEKYEARVVAIDISPTNIEQARKRDAGEAAGDRVTLLLADAHRLPFVNETFDVAILESVLIFCQAEVVLSEAHRVLKSGGTFADNELTLVGAPLRGLNSLLVETLRIRAFSERDWRRMFEEAGFSEVASAAHRMSLREQLLSHIRVDGIAAYLTALRKGLANGEIRRVFINRDMLRAARRFAPYIGYHLYVGRKGGNGAA